MNKKGQKVLHASLVGILGLSLTVSSGLPLAVRAAEQQKATTVKESTAEALKNSLQTQKKASLDKKKAAFDEAVRQQMIAKGLLSKDAKTPTDLGDTTIRIIVRLSAKAGVTSAKTSNAAASASQAKVIAKQDTVQKEVETITGQTVRRSFGYVVNGFSIDATEAQITKIEELDGVDSVTAARVFYKTDDAANELANVQKVWEKYKLKGEGMVVSIIDSGIDASHKDLKLTNPAAAAISQADSQADAKKLGYGQYFTAKVPYGHNYADNNENIVDNGVNEMHGQHVGGIVASNGTVQGVAPEAQLLAMKVFSNNAGNTGAYSDDIINAIDDSVTLGANVLNMSLGSVSGTMDAKDPEQMAVANAKKAGVISVISAGNSSVSSSNDTNADPQTTFDESFQDTATVGSPGVSKDALTVASSENSVVSYQAFASKDLTFKDVEGSQNAIYTASPLMDVTALTKEQAIVAVGTGAESDYEGKDVKGKIALIKRGDLSFAEKAQNAKTHGAIAAIIYNNVDGSPISMSLEDESYPTLGITLSAGQIIEQALKDGQKSFQFTLTTTKVNNPEAGKMSTFSSWGPTPNLELKPEISAPGGQIYSLANSNNYQTMSGTSMASPFVAGSEALVLEAAKANKLSLSGSALVDFAKRSVLNTAVPMLDVAHNNEIISPRRQGAGQIQVDKAIENTTSLVNQATNEGTVALKEIKSKTTFSVVLTNHGSKTATYTYNDYGGAYTQSYTDDKFMYDSKIDGATLKSTTEKVTLKPGASKTVTLTLTVPSSFKTNQFVEGYVGFSGDNVPNLVIPYMGFYGDYQAQQIIDNVVWDTSKTSSAMNAGYLVADKKYLVGYNGTTIDPDLASFSPNEDGLFDSVNTKLFFLRNYSSAKYEIVDKNKQLIRSLYEEKDGRKNYYNPKTQAWTTTTASGASWDGTIVDQKTGKSKTVLDGQYSYRVTVKSTETSKEQVIYLPIKVDTTAPEINNIQVTADGYIQFTATDNFTGVDQESLAVSVNDQAPQTAAFEAVAGEKNTYRSTTAVAANLENGRSTISVALMDGAGNTGEAQTIVNSDDLNHLLVYNVADNAVITTQSSNYNAETKQLHITGSYGPKQTFYINQTSVKTDADGLFAADVPINASTTNLTFSQDATQKKVLKKVPLKVLVAAPSLTITPHSTAAIQVTEGNYTLKGNTTATSVGVENTATGQKLDATSSLKDGQFSLAVPLVYGQNLLRVTATDDAGNETLQTQMIQTTSKENLQSQAVVFDNIYGDNNAYITASDPNYDAKTKTLAITGHLNYPVANFKLNNETVTVNPTDLSFSYPLKNVTTGKQSVAIYLQDPSLNNGEPLVNVGYFLFADTVMPTLAIKGLQADDQGNLSAKTNQSPFTLKGTVDDNLSGYTLQINNNTVVQDAYKESFNEEMFAGKPATDFAYPVQLGKGVNKLNVLLSDAVGNEVSKAVTLDYKKVALPAPTVTPSTTEYTNQAISLKVSNAPTDAQTYFSYDNKTWEVVTDAVSIAENRTVYYHYADAYGNVSPTTAVQVNTILKELPQQVEPTIQTTGDGTKAKPLQVVLGYNKTLTPDEQKLVHIEYAVTPATDSSASTTATTAQARSLVKATTKWTTYKEPITLTESSSIHVRVVDLAGNTSSEKELTVVLQPVKTEGQGTGSGTNPDQSDSEEPTSTEQDAAGEPAATDTDAGTNSEQPTQNPDPSSVNTEQPTNLVAGNSFVAIGGTAEAASTQTVLPQTDEQTTAKQTLIGVVLVLLLGTGLVYRKKTK